MADQSKREEKYLENLRSLAAKGTTEALGGAPDLDTRLAEIRRWEGNEAAEQFRRDFRNAQEGPRHPVSKAGPARSASSPVQSGQVGVTHTNTLAILALIFGIGGGILGIVFGHVALAQIERSGEEGRGLAIGGLVCGYVGVGISIIILIATMTALN